MTHQIHSCGWAAHLQVWAESVKNADMMILPDIMESYYNCTHQTLDMFRLAAVDPSATHLLKASQLGAGICGHLDGWSDRRTDLVQTDDDCFVRVDKFLVQLSSLPRERLFWGDIYIDYGPERNVGSKWYVNETEWEPGLYPPYAPGIAIILSIDLVREISAGRNMQSNRPDK